MKIAWVRGSPGHPLAKQVEAAKAWGAEKIWGTEPHETVADFIRALRPKDQPGVATLARLAASRALIREALEAIAEKGLVVHEFTTGRRSDRHGAQMALDAADELAGDRRRLKKSDAKRYGRLGALATNAKKAENRSPAKMARMVWRDTVRYPRVEDAVAALEGWDKRTLYRHFKKRGSPAGRPTRTK